MKPAPAAAARYSSGSHEAAQTGKRQRLIICFDGTWNSRDSGTNVTHLANLIKEGPVADGFVQRVYYDPGVGTGKLDRLTGGAFGSGLSENVCEAYDWLIEQYTQSDAADECDDKERRDARTRAATQTAAPAVVYDDAFDQENRDHIYIFGFSRGAFTARSLVGFIAKCGLLMRGAPLPLDQLWEGYQLLGRYPSSRQGGVAEKNWWERIAGSPPKMFREYYDLLRHAGSLNATERLLLEWSRRTPIRCVGVFDTVGSLGIDALAIPGLRTKFAKFHDTRLTSLIVNGFQALAIDENRANFAHIPWHHELKTHVAKGKSLRGGTIEQRWFTGAHSNIGGGLEDDVLAQYTLRWMIDECKHLHLEFREGEPELPPPAPTHVTPLMRPEPPRPNLETPKPYLRDTYSDFAGGIWRYLIRAKRAYRRIDPPPEVMYGEPAQTVNETMDATAKHFFELVTDYCPPNAWEYLHRTGQTQSPPPRHRYLDGAKDTAFLLVWVVAIGVGAYALAGWAGPAVARRIELPVHHGSEWWLAIVVALVALAFDWLESHVNFERALNPDDASASRRESTLNVLIAVRLVSLAFVACAVAWLLVWPVKWFMIAPDTWTRDLALVAGLWVLFQIGLSAQAAPTSSVGMPSVVGLQGKRTPAEVTAVLVRAANGGPEPNPALLKPFGESLWLDVLVFIPAYSIVFLAVAWISIRTRTGLAAMIDPLHWWPAFAAGVGLCAITDWLEDAVHLSYIRPTGAPPIIRPPSAGRVSFARLMTAAKVVLFSIGLLATIWTSAHLVWRQLSHWPVGGLAGLSAAAVVVIAGGSIHRLVTGRKDPAAD
jgi:uncharacterized protein (DUF2235 family)